MDKQLLYFADTFSDFDKDYRDRIRGWNKWNAQWRGQFDPGGGKQKTDGIMPDTHREVATKSKLYVNQTKVAVASAVATVMSILFQQAPPFDVSGRSSQLDEDIAKMIQKVVWYFLQQSRFPVQAKRYTTDAAVYGSAWGKIYMEMIRDARVVFNPNVDEVGILQGYKRVEKVEEFPMVRWGAVSPYDMWVDAESDWITGFGRGVFHRVRKSTSTVKEMIKRGRWRQPNETLLNENLGPQAGSLDTRDARRQLEGLSNLMRKELCLYDFWGVMPAENAEYFKLDALSDEEAVPVHLILLGTESASITDWLFAERNPLPAHDIPFVHDVWEDLGHSPHGRGICENSNGPQMALNVAVNSGLDNRSTAIQQILGVNIDGLENPEEDLVYKQNWIIRCTGKPQDTIYPLTVPNMTVGMDMEIARYEKMIEEQSGVSKLAPDSFGSNRTANGIGMVVQAASKTLRDITMQFEQNLIARTAKLIYQHVLLFMPDKFLVDLTDNPLVPLMRQVELPKIVADVDFMASGLTGIQQKETELQALTQFAQLTANPVDLQYIDRPKLIKNIYERFGFKDGDEIIKGLPSDQQLVLQQLIAALQNAGGQQQPQSAQQGGPQPAGTIAPVAGLAQPNPVGGMGSTGGPTQ